MNLRSPSHRFLFRCLAAALGGVLFGVAGAAPIPVSDLVQGFSPAFAYSLSPDGRHVLRRDHRSLRLEMLPVGEGGEVGEPIDLTRHRMRIAIWARDGSRLYGIRYRERTPLALAIDPARLEAKAREIPLAGIAARVFHAFQHPTKDDRLVLRTFGRQGESVLHCELNGAGCESVSSAGGGWRTIIDWDGRPAVRHRFAGAAHEFQTLLGGEWTAAGEMKVDRTLVPLAPLDPDGWALALSNLTRDTISLVRWNARTGEERVVSSTPEADLQGVFLSASGEPLATTSFPGYPRTTALHPSVERVLDIVRARHPEPALVNVAAADTALTRFVVEVFDEVRARVAYLVSLPRGAVEEFDWSPAGRRFQDDFSPTQAVRIPARDGLELPGLLTVPRDPPESGPPPLVLMVHGGPWLFYKWTFDPLAQLLASRGYAVLKLNYRGSSGYGNRFREAAVGELARRVQEDVEDAFDWAVREGYADRSRLAMIGDSFGGFCVLAAMARGRLPVRAGVVLSGVVDSEAMVDENAFSPEGRAMWTKYLGTGDIDEMKRILREVSPIRHVDRIRAPVLLLAGNTDRVVQSRHAATLAGELRKRGRVAELLSFPREGHSIVRPANVIEAYRRTVTFLDRHVD